MYLSRSLEAADIQRVANTYCFGLQNLWFRNAKLIVLASKTYGFKNQRLQRRD